MSKNCQFNLAIAISGFSLVLIVVSLTTNFWYIVEVSNKQKETLNPELRQNFQYPFNLGVWMTCYNKNIPDTVLAENLILENCFLDYDFSSKRVEEFARTNAVCLTMACGIIVICGFLAITGRVRDRRVPIQVGGVLLLVSGFVTIIGMCCFIGRILLEKEAVNFPRDQNIVEYFSWSFYLGWVSPLLQLVSGGIFVKISSNYGDMENANSNVV